LHKGNLDAASNTSYNIQSLDELGAVPHQGVIARKSTRHDVSAHDDVAHKAGGEAQHGQHSLTVSTAVGKGGGT